MQTNAVDHEQALLPRRLRLVETAALTFSTVGATAGIYSLFGFSLASAGPAFVWGWLIVGVFVFAMCLMWAELASHMPLAGSMYHWARAVSGPRRGWWVGWLYLFAQILVLTSWYFLVPITLGPLLGVQFDGTQSALVALAVIVVATVLNAFGIELLGKIIVVGVVFELIVGFVLTAVLFFKSEHQPLSIFFDLGAATSLSDWIPAFVGGGAFLALWVLFTFESAGAVGEETHDAHRAAPKAVLLAFVGTIIIGICFLFTAVLAIPDVQAVTNSATPLPDIFNAWLPSWVSQTYLVLLLGIEILGCNAFFTAVSRQFFGMARAEQLPFSRALSRTRNGTPFVAIFTVGAIALVPLIFSQQMSVLAIGATAAIYVPYTVLLILLLIARVRRWPTADAPFKLGHWGLPMNVVAVVGAVLSLLTLLWPRDATNPEFNGIRVSYWLIGGIVGGGLVYYLAAKHGALGRVQESETQLIAFEESEAASDAQDPK